MTERKTISAEVFIDKFKSAMRHPDHRVHTLPDIFHPGDDRRIVSVEPISFRILRNSWDHSTPHENKYFASVYRWESPWVDCEDLTPEQGDELRALVDAEMDKWKEEYAQKIFDAL